MRWKTDEIKTLATEICCDLDNPLLAVSIGGAGGDWDTNRVFIHFEDDFVSICGFNTSNFDSYTINRDDVEAEMIEMTSCHSSSGDGVDTKHEPLMLASWRLKQRLEKSGWCVVACIKNYW